MKLYFKGRFTIFISLYVVFPDDFLISVSIFMFLTWLEVSSNSDIQLRSQDVSINPARVVTV